MDKEQKIAEIKAELQRLKSIKERGDKVNFWNLLKILGVDEKIINNPNPYDLGMGLDFDNYIQALNNANITIKDNGNIVLETEIGNAYLVNEGKLVDGINIVLSVIEGKFYMRAAYKKDNLSGVDNRFEMIAVPNGNDNFIRTSRSEYHLESRYNKEKQKQETRGAGFCVISNYDKFGIETESSRVSYANTPNILVTSSGINLKDVIEQDSIAKSDTFGYRDLERISPVMACANKDSAFFRREVLGRRMESIDKVEIISRDKESNNQECRYHLNLTGEHNMAHIFNNSESYFTEEELDSVRVQRLEEGWYDKKIETYKQQGGITANQIANCIEQAKLKLEEKKGKTL